MSRNEQSMLPIKPTALAVIFCALVAGLVFLVAFAKLTDREVVMLGVVQTMLSVAIGWLLTHGYAEQSQKLAIEDVEDRHQKNLKTYALKAAEKVENLSKEIARLERYLEVELEEGRYNSPQEALFAKQERIESAIHVLNTLRSVNDTSLSDWRGVIPEELDQRRIEVQQYERRLESLLERLEMLDPEFDAIDETAENSGVDVGRLESEISSLKSQLKDLAREVGAPFTAKRRSAEHLNAQMPCPACDLVQSFKLKPGKSGKQALHCINCDVSLVATLSSEGEVLIRERINLPERVECPSCVATIEFELDEWPSSSAKIDCYKCDSTFKVSRASDGLRTFGLQQRLTELTISKVRVLLPAQPWEKGIHKAISVKTELPPGLVQRAIQALIDAGEFMQQIDGVLYSPEQIAALKKARKASGVFESLE